MSRLPSDATPWLLPNEGPKGAIGRAPPELLDLILVGFISVSIYNGLELCVLLFLAFRRYEGLYFWSLLITNVLGALPNSVFMSLLVFRDVSLIVPFTLSELSLWVMVTGHSIVLYSRLYIILSNKIVLHLVLAMIIVCSVLFNISDAVVGITMAARFPTGHISWYHGWTVIEKAHVTGFAVVEIIISAIYLYQCTKLLRFVSERSRRQTIYNIAGVSLAVVLMDFLLISLIYLEWWIIQTTLRPMFYSIKLKLELAVLRKLISASQESLPAEIPDFVNANEIRGDLRHAAPEVDQREQPSYIVPNRGEGDAPSAGGESILDAATDDDGASTLSPGRALRNSLESHISASTYPSLAKRLPQREPSSRQSSPSRLATPLSSHEGRGSLEA